MKILLFDTILNGHHADYIGHLARHWQSQAGELFIVTPAGLAQSLPEKYPPGSGVVFMELTDQEVRESQTAGAVRRSFTDWNLFVTYARRVGPSHALLMYADIFQLGLWLGKKAPCKVSGIYFRPGMGYGESSRREKLVALRKNFLLRRMLTAPQLSTLFCLDKSVVPAIRQFNRHVQVVPLSDPVRRYDRSPERVENLRRSLGIDAHRRIFLLFGWLDGRKGIEPVLEAIGQLSEAESSKLTLLLAGPISADYRADIEDCIARLPAEAQVVCCFQEIKNAAIQDFFDLSDFVLTLYRRHVGMSSIVVRAARSEKPLISSDFGYMGRLVAENNLGLTLDSESPEAITQAFKTALRGEIRASQEAMQKLARENTDEVFARQLLSVMMS